MQDEVQTEVAPEVPVEAPAVEAPPTEEPAQEAKPEAEQPRDEAGKFKPKAGVQQRIDELTRARHEAEREAAFWRAKAGTAEAESAKPAPKPEASQFSDYSEYVEALADWKAGQKIAEALSQQSAKAAEQHAKTAEQMQVEQWQARQADARKSIPDFDQVMNAADIAVSQAVQQSILESDLGPQIAYELAKRPDEAARISALSPLAAAREIGRIEARLASAAPATKPVSNAPAPINPIKGGATRNPSNDPAKMSHEEYRAFRAKQGARWAK